MVFDLDRTLLNKDAELTPFTLQTLSELDKRGIHYTLATGRSFLSAARIIKDHAFPLPQIYTNGVVTWCPKQACFSFDNCLTRDESLHALSTMKSDAAHPFISAINGNGQRIVYHGEFKNKIEQQILNRFSELNGTELVPVNKIANNVHITNISMVGPSEHVISAHKKIDDMKHLTAYSGQAVEHEEFRWIDIHHVKANKGAAVTRLKEQLNLDSIICFGDGDNDLSMFDIADECYAPANANKENKEIATAIIGHHDEDGVALFLKERFSL